MTLLSDDELHTETPWQTGESVGVLPSLHASGAGYYKGSEDGSGLRANGDRPLRSTRSRLDRDEVTP